MRGATQPNGPAAGQPAMPQATVPFVAGAHEHTEPAFDVQVTPNATTQNLGPFDVPAYGYLRHIWLHVSTNTAGSGGAPVASADYPFNLFQSIAMLDVNGAPIFGQLDGYAALWANIVGGYGFRSDPRTAPMFNASVTSPSFWLRIPIEISHHDGLGALPNQNATSNYKIQLSLNPNTIAWTTPNTVNPVLRIRGYLEAWSLPNASDVAGRPQAQVPPMVGTTQYWSANTKNIAVGYQNTLLPRVGNLIRNLVFIARDGTGARNNGVFPDPAILGWDARDMLNDVQAYRQSVAHERFAPLLQAIDTGVFIYALDHSDHGQVGDDNATLWYQTVQATRLEIKGTSATAGTIQCMTNDVAPVEVNSTERYVEGSATGFHPGLGGPVPAQ